MKKFIFIFVLIPLLFSCGSVSASQSDCDYTCASWTPPSSHDAETHLWYAPLLNAKGAARKYHRLMKEQPEKIHASLKALAGWYSDKLTPKA